MNLPPDIQTAQNINGAWTIYFSTTNIPRLITRIVISGGPGNTLKVYMGNILIDTTPNGDVNSAEYFQPIYLPAGQQISLVWSNATGSAPEGILFTKEAL